MAFSPTASPAEIEASARGHCEGRQFCKVLGWHSGDAVASAMPLTDREVAAQRFDLTINRASGMDKMMWIKR